MPETEEFAGQEEEVTEQEAVEETGQAGEEGETAAPPEEDPKLKAAIAQARDEKRKRQDIERRLQVFESQQAVVIPPPDAVKPKPEDYVDYDLYVEALADYKARQIFRSEAENSRNLTKAEVAKRAELALQNKAATDAKKAAEKYVDFYDVAGSVSLPAESLKAMYQSDIGTEIAYYLGSNPAELDRLNDLSPSRQIMELGKLEAKLAAKTANPKAKEIRKATGVETSGNGFQKPKTDLSKILERAKATGDWTQYLEATGNL